MKQKRQDKKGSFRMKKMICILALTLLCTGCTSCSMNTADATESTAFSTAKAIENTTGDSVIEVSAMAAPDRTKSDQSYYQPLNTHTTDENYVMSGTIHLDQWRGLVKIVAPEDAVLTIKGTLTKAEGEIQLLCDEPDGNIATLAESTDNTDQPLSIDAAINIKSGTSYIYFFGLDSVYDFDINLGLSDDFKYYLY